MRCVWRDGGGRTRLVGVPELGRMMGIHPILALSVLSGLGRWKASRSGGGMDPQRKGWVRVQHQAGGTTRSSSTTTTTSGERTPPPPRPSNPMLQLLQPLSCNNLRVVADRSQPPPRYR